LLPFQSRSSANRSAFSSSNQPTNCPASSITFILAMFFPPLQSDHSLSHITRKGNARGSAVYIVHAGGVDELPHRPPPGVVRRPLLGHVRRIQDDSDIGARSVLIEPGMRPFNLPADRPNVTAINRMYPTDVNPSVPE